MDIVRLRWCPARADREPRQVDVAVTIEDHVGVVDVAVGDPPSVCERERGRHLLDDQEALGSDRAPRLARRGIAARDRAGSAHDVRPARLAPVVVDRDDVRVLERGDRLRVAARTARTKPASLATCGVERPRPPRRGRRAAGSPGRPGTRPRRSSPAGGTPAAARPWSSRSGILLAGPARAAGRGPRDGSIPSSSAMISAGALERRQRVGLAPFPVEREHQLAPQALPQRVWPSSASASPTARASAAREQRPEPLLLRHQPELVEPRGHRQQVVGEVGERRTAPQRSASSSVSAATLGSVRRAFRASRSSASNGSRRRRRITTRT